MPYLTLLRCSHCWFERVFGLSSPLSLSWALIILTQTTPLLPSSAMSAPYSCSSSSREGYFTFCLAWRPWWPTTSVLPLRLHSIKFDAITTKKEINLTQRPVSMLGHFDRHRLGNIIVFAIQKHHHIGILLNGARFTKIR